MTEKHYPDTREGVRDLMRDQSYLTAKEIEKATIEIDPHVTGCWLMKAIKSGEEEWFLVYVSNHHWDSAPTFEEVSIPEDRTKY